MLECPEVDRFRPVVNLTADGLGAAPGQGPVRRSALACPTTCSTKVRNGGLDRIAPRPVSRARRPRPAGRRDGHGHGCRHAARYPDGASPCRRRHARRVAVRGRPALANAPRLRQEWAREAKVPLYIIFPNQVLDELVRMRPRTPQALADDQGARPLAARTLRRELLAAIAEAPAPPTGDADFPPAAASNVRETAASTPDPGPEQEPGPRRPPGNGKGMTSRDGTSPRPPRTRPARPPAYSPRRDRRVSPAPSQAPCGVRPDRGMELPVARTRVHAR